MLHTVIGWKLLTALVACSLTMNISFVMFKKFLTLVKAVPINDKSDITDRGVFFVSLLRHLGVLSQEIKFKNKNKNKTGFIYYLFKQKI